MRIEMQKGDAADELQASSWTVGFHGEVLDDRGRVAVEYLRARVGRLVQLKYDPDDFTVSFDQRVVGADDLGQEFTAFNGQTVVLESTTLGFVEILLSCRCLRRLGISVLDFLYIEPLSYNGPRRLQLLHRRDFELSGVVPGYRAIPGAAMLLSERAVQKGVFFLGYEERRLERAFEDLQMIQARHATVAFGVPAFRPGWEMDAVANNIQIVREKNIRGGVRFCGAENPMGVIEILEELHRGLTHGERMFVAPIGTKPHGIGAALFVCDHTDVRVIYDHPQRSTGRSRNVAHWHLFTAVF